MATLLDANDQPVQVPDDQVHDAIAAHTAFVPAGQTLGVTDNEGNFSEVPSESVYDVIGAGGRILNPQEYAEQKHGSLGQQAITAIEQAGAGATAGLSLAAEKGLGLTTQADIEGRATANPATAIGFGLTGAVLPALLGDEVSPAALIARGGEGITEALGGGVGARMVAGAAEAGAFGGISEASRQAFDGKPADISKVLSAAGTDSVFGAGAGGLFGAIGALGRRAAGFAGPGIDAAGVGVEDIGRSLDAKAEEDPTTIFGKVMSALVGPEKANSFKRLTRDRDWRTLANTPEATVSKTFVDGSEQIDGLVKEVNDLVDKTRIVKNAEVDAGLKMVDPVKARNAGFDLVQNMNAAIDTMVNEPHNYFGSRRIEQFAKQVDELARVLGVEEIGSDGIVTSMRRAAGHVREQETQAGGGWLLRRRAAPRPTLTLDPAETPTAEEIFHAFDNAKKNLDILAPTFEKQIANEDRPVSKLIQKFRAAQAGNDGFDGINAFLRDSDKFGDAAASFSKHNDLISKALGIKQDYYSEFGHGEGFAGGKKQFVTDPGKVKAMFDGAGTAENELKKSAFMNMLTGVREIAEQAGEANADLDARLKSMLPGTRDLANLSKAKGDLAKLAGNSSSAAGIMGNSFGRAALGGLVGGPIGAAVGIVADPAAVPQVLHILDRIVGGQDAKVAALAAAIASGTRPTIGRAPLGIAQVLESARFTDRAYPEKSKTPAQAYVRRTAEIRALMSDPEKATALVTRAIGPIAAAHPEAGQALVQQSIHGLQVLASQMPPSPPSSPLNPFAAQTPPGQVAQAQFADAVRVYTTPMSVMEDLAHGRLSPLAAENLRAMYPDLHQQMAEKILASVHATGKITPYAMRLQISLFLGQDLDPSLLGPSVAASQAAYAPPPGAGSSPKLQSSKDIKSIANAASAMQQMEMRASASA